MNGDLKSELITESLNIKKPMTKKFDHKYFNARKSLNSFYSEPLVEVDEIRSKEGVKNQNRETRKRALSFVPKIDRLINTSTYQSPMHNNTNLNPSKNKVIEVKHLENHISENLIPNPKILSSPNSPATPKTTSITSTKPTNPLPGNNSPQHIP